MVLSSLSFAAMNLCIKFLPGIPFYEIVLFRAVVSLIISYYLLKRARISIWGNNKKLLIARGLFGFVSLTLYFYTVKEIQLASAVTLQYLSPIFTTLFAVFILGQKVKWLQILFFALAFYGVFLIKDFDSTVDTKLLLLGIASAIFSGLAYNMIAKLKGQDKPLVIVFYFPLVTIPLIAPYTLFNFIMPTWVELVLLILTGIFTQIAQILMTKAYQTDKAANISILTYLGLVYALILGKFVLNETYTSMTLVGMGLIVAGILANILYSRRANKT
ncbi:MAG: DMT family transporter [Bacteroidetes bacterium]|nr:DMT family transporter [Bacteroidota bacterium]